MLIDQGKNIKKNKSDNFRIHSIGLGKIYLLLSKKKDQYPPFKRKLLRKISIWYTNFLELPNINSCLLVGILIDFPNSSLFWGGVFLISNFVWSVLSTDLIDLILFIKKTENKYGPKNPAYAIKSLIN